MPQSKGIQECCRSRLVCMNRENGDFSIYSLYIINTLIFFIMNCLQNTHQSAFDSIVKNAKSLLPSNRTGMVPVRLIKFFVVPSL